MTRNKDLARQNLEICYSWCLFLLDKKDLSESCYVISPENLAFKGDNSYVNVRSIIIELTSDEDKNPLLHLSYFRRVLNREISNEGQIVGLQKDDKVSEEVKKICNRTGIEDGFLFVKKDLEDCMNKLAKLLNN